jgi:hypothetical protein
VKILIAVAVFLGFSACLSAQTDKADANGAQPLAVGGILLSFQNAGFTSQGKHYAGGRKDPNIPVEMNFANCEGVGVDREHDQWWVLPISVTGAQIDANKGLWVLPADAASKDHSWYLELNSGNVSATKTGNGLKVSLNADSFTVFQAEARPHSDSFNHRFSFKIAGGTEFENALAGFYWGTMLPSVVEKTMAANFPYSSGYVLSTLNVTSYAGSYPAVDHEFQIKGRLAMGSEVDLDVVKRMIELQFKLMNDDPEHLSRAPTSVQPDGSREYHVRRNSEDDRQNAAMFPLTGNIEVIEEAWHYYDATKDSSWLQNNIGNLEHAADWTLANTDQYGRVWSDVYYEDQVIEDGRVTQAQAFAAYTFKLLADIENLLHRPDKATHFSEVSKKIADALIEPLPNGYWDEKNQRFIDWVDRNGKVHDHIHLLANTLPVTFGYATAAQASAVRRMIDENAGQFERFPSFVAADIAGYDRSEIGSGGPYDLCAAGRYWYWDAAFRESRSQNEVLFDQLKTVAAEGAKDNYFMDERYDMDYVYYKDGRNSHGAKKYYEYPNVFTAVLISKYLGLTIPVDADVSVAPHINGPGSVEFGVSNFALLYSYEENGFVLQNLANKQRRFQVDLSGLGKSVARYRLESKAMRGLVGARSTVTLAPQEEAHWVPLQ